MALEKEPSFVISLGEIVNTRLQAYSKTVTAIRAKQDADFSSKVAELGLTYDQQATYYKTRLDAEKKSDFPDESYIETLTSNFDNLNKLARYQDFQDKYKNDLDAYSTGKLDIGSLITEVTNAMNNETDQTNKNSMRDELSKLKTQQFTSFQNVLTNKISLAENDQSIPTLNDMLGQVQTLQSEALASGNEELAGSYALQAQKIKSDVSSITVQKKTNDITLATINGNIKSGDKLSQLQNLVNGADANSPVTIGGVRYNSEKDYWAGQQNAYLSGNGSGLFGDIAKDINTEMTATLNVSAAHSSNGAIPFSDLINVNNTFSTLLANPAVGPYADRINGVKVSILSNASATNVNAINAEYGVSGDYSKAMQDFTNLETITGINQATNKQILIGNEATSKEKQANSTKAVTITPDTLADPKNTPSDIYAAEQGGKNLPSETPAPVVPKVESTIPKPAQPAQPTQTPAQPTQPVVPVTVTPTKYTVAKGDTLSALAIKNKTTVQKLVEANKIADANKIQIGQQLIIP